MFSGWRSIPIFDVHIATGALECVERYRDRYLVVMDNVALDEEAIAFSNTLCALPKAHATVRVMGFATQRREERTQFNAFLELHFTVDALLDALER